MNGQNSKRVLSFISVAAAVLAVVLAAGCISGENGPNGGGAAPAETPDTGISEEVTVFGHTWVLKSFYDSETGKSVETGDVHATLVLGEDGEMSGNSGCNQFSGSYELKGDVFAAGLIKSTLMACGDEKTALTESCYLFGLNTASKLVYDENSLIFLDENEKELLRFEKFVPSDYEWKLVSMKSGDALVSIPENAEVTLVFDDEKISGNAGCNSYFAAYTTDGISEISFSGAGSTKMACPDDEIMNTESLYLELLGEVKGFLLSGNSLYFTDGEGKTLLSFVIVP